MYNKPHHSINTAPDLAHNHTIPDYPYIMDYYIMLMQLTDAYNYYNPRA